LAATAITSMTAGCYFMGITVARVTDQELGLLMLWMLPVCVTTPAGVSTPSRAAPAMQDCNMKQRQSRAIPHNRRIFSFWLQSRGGCWLIAVSATFTGVSRSTEQPTGARQPVDKRFPGD